MRYPVSVGPARQDFKNGGEYRVLKDSDGAWLGDLRDEHALAIAVIVNAYLVAPASKPQDSTP